MPVWLMVIVLVLAAYRLTRLAVRDDFPPVRIPRDWIKAHAPETIGELVSCHWCASGWLSMALVAGTDWVTSVPMPVTLWLAVWAGAAWLAHHERESADVIGVSARVVHEGLAGPGRLRGAAGDLDQALAAMREEWGTLGLVRRTLEGLPPKQQQAVLDAVAEHAGRRYAPGGAVPTPRDQRDPA